MFNRLIKKLFGFDKSVHIEDFKFAPAWVRHGSVFRKGWTVWHPYAPGPYSESNWFSKGCAIIILRVKLFEFTARQPDWKSKG